MSSSPSVFVVLAVCIAVSLSLVSVAWAATPGQKNALRSARVVLFQGTEAFSRSGLIHQLKFEGYTTAQATWGVVHVHSELERGGCEERQGVPASLEPFSRSGLIQQLRFEGYTLGQATYGVRTAPVCSAGTARRADVVLGKQPASRDVALPELSLRDGETQPDGHRRPMGDEAGVPRADSTLTRSPHGR